MQLPLALIPLIPAQLIVVTQHVILLQARKMECQWRLRTECLDDGAVDAAIGVLDWPAAGFVDAQWGMHGRGSSLSYGHGSPPLCNERMAGSRAAGWAGETVCAASAAALAGEVSANGSRRNRDD